MSLPAGTTPAEIRAAAARFDADPSRFHKPTRFAVLIDGRAYPPKAIIALATGLPVSGFSGGQESNRWLVKRGFQIISVADATPGDS